MILRAFCCIFLFLLPVARIEAQTGTAPEAEPVSTTLLLEEDSAKLPDEPALSPSVVRELPAPGSPFARSQSDAPRSSSWLDRSPSVSSSSSIGASNPAVQSRALPPASPAEEPYHWKGLLLQSLAFQLLEHGPRIMAADAADRHLLFNKPFWSDYWASLGQFNMRRWNDGDSFIVNYGGHPMQGAISGYIEVQNDPRGRGLQFSRDRRYWNSRFRAFLWATVYSTEFEIGPLSEASIFNEGGYTYPIRCTSNSTAPGGCDRRDATYTNNTGWVDFIITPRRRHPAPGRRRCHRPLHHGSARAPPSQGLPLQGPSFLA